MSSQERRDLAEQLRIVDKKIEERYNKTDRCMALASEIEVLLIRIAMTEDKLKKEKEELCLKQKTITELRVTVTKEENDETIESLFEKRREIARFPS